MRSFLYILTALGVMALAVWAYHENHRTQQAQAELHAIEREIRALREALSVQRAEWAYLNRPERLRQLAEMNFDVLGLVPLSSGQFGRIEEIAYPLPGHDDAPDPGLGHELGRVIETLGRIEHTAASPETTTMPQEP
ncbi:MAG: cell division protein FtsL [Pararhodobacter sp.]|nr:cell division protein FtsL [Pararhodobacter sp.]